MISEIVMPQGGQDLKTGQIVRWLCTEGQHVKKGDVIGEVETEKAVFEVMAPQDGVLLKILANEGEEVEVLSTIAYIGAEGESIPQESVLKKEPDRESKNNSIFPRLSDSNAGKGSKKIKITPKARKLANDHGIPIEKLTSNQPSGIIKSEDVERSIQSISGAGDANDGTRKVFTRARKITARRLTKSWTSTPHIFVTRAVDMTSALAFRKASTIGEYSINDMVVRACALGLKMFPDVNASYSDEDGYIQWKDINIGIAIATKAGLLVGVIEEVDLLSLHEIGKRSRDIAEKVRAGKKVLNKPSHFTVSNLGMYDVDQFTAVVNPPEAAILAVSTIQKKPIVLENGQIAVRDMMNITVALDHRIGDGVLAAKFINEVKHLLESQELL